MHFKYDQFCPGMVVQLFLKTCQTYMYIVQINSSQGPSIEMLLFPWTMSSESICPAL